MRMSAKAEYAVRAMVQLATVDGGVRVKTEDLANAQGIPPQFLVDILSDLRTDRLVRSHRGRDGGYELARPGTEISIADVLRSIDGPLAGAAGQHALGAGRNDAGRRGDRSLAGPRRSDGRRLSRPGKQAPRPPQRRVCLAARAVGPGENLQEVASGVAEVDPAAAVVGVDLARPTSARVGPVLQAARLDLAVDRVEVVLRDQERIVLRSDLLTFGYIGVVEASAMLERDGQEVAEWRRARQSEQLGQKLRGLPFIAGSDNRVVELDRHCAASLLRRG